MSESGFQKDGYSHKNLNHVTEYSHQLDQQPQACGYASIAQLSTANDGFAHSVSLVALCAMLAQESLRLQSPST